MLQRFFRPRRNVLSEMKAVSQILQDELVHEDDYEWAVCELCGGALLCLDDSADPARGVWATRLPCACRPPPRPAPPAQRGGGGSGLRRGCPATCRGPANIAHDASRVLQEMCFAGALAASEGGAGRRFHRECIRDYVLEASGMCDDDCAAAEPVGCPACYAPLDWAEPGYDWQAGGGGGGEDEDGGVCGATLGFICENQVRLRRPP